MKAIDPGIIRQIFVLLLILLIGVVVGIPLFGFIGLIFGPLLVNLFLIIVRIYKKEYGQNTQ